MGTSLKENSEICESLLSKKDDAYLNLGRVMKISSSFSRITLLRLMYSRLFWKPYAFLRHSGLPLVGSSCLLSSQS